jgi:hypothetical protein
MIDTYSFFVGMWAGFCVAWFIAGAWLLKRKIKKEGG